VLALTWPAAAAGASEFRLSLALPDQVRVGAALVVSARVSGVPAGSHTVLEEQLENGAWSMVLVAPVRPGRVSLRWRATAAGGAHVRLLVRWHGRDLLVSASLPVRIDPAR